MISVPSDINGSLDNLRLCTMVSCGIGFNVMPIMVDANGSGAGKGTYLSVYAATSEREYDAGLNWPFILEK